jgi:hypothetical protein
LSRSREHRPGIRRLDEMEDLFLLALVGYHRGGVVVASLLYMNYIDGPLLPLTSEWPSIKRDASRPGSRSTPAILWRSRYVQPHRGRLRHLSVLQMRRGRVRHASEEAYFDQVSDSCRGCRQRLVGAYRSRSPFSAGQGCRVTARTSAILPVAWRGPASCSGLGQ